MKMIAVVALALVAVASALPLPEEPATVLHSELQQQPDGPYKSSFETSNGIKQEEEGQLKEVLDEEKKPHTVVVIRGSFEYPGEDGKPVHTNYYADETGFHAEGDSIPQLSSRR